MPYNETLSNRVRELLADAGDVGERLMFGGICFLVEGKMCVGVMKDDLMCRVGPHRYEEVLERRGCREMDFAGRPMLITLFPGAQTVALASRP